MRLSEVRQQSSKYGQSQSSDSTTGGFPLDAQSAGTIRTAVAYHRPIDATLNGRPVTLIATGDIVGMSPAEKFVDEFGRLDWASSDDFVVNDPTLIPLGLEQRQKLQQGRTTR